MIIILIVLIIGFSGCVTDNSYSMEDPTKIVNSESPEAGSTKSRSGVTSPAQARFRKEDGALVFEGGKKELKKSSGLITIYDRAGAPWKVIDHNDDGLGAMSEPGGRFRPLSFRTGNFDLQLRVTGRSKDWFEVIVQNEKPVKVLGYVRTGDRSFKFYKWDQWVLSHLNLRYDPEGNPVRDLAGGTRVMLASPSGMLVSPVEVKGEWVRVRWAKLGDNRGPEELKRSHPGNVGWLRWRKGDRILVWEFYP